MCVHAVCGECRDACRVVGSLLAWALGSLTPDTLDLALAPEEQVHRSISSSRYLIGTVGVDAGSGSAGLPARVHPAGSPQPLALRAQGLATLVYRQYVPGCAMCR